MKELANDAMLCSTWRGVWRGGSAPLSPFLCRQQGATIKKLKRDKLLCFFFLVKMAESEITEASIKDALTQRLKAIHAEVTDMSGMSLVSSGR